MEVINNNAATLSNFEVYNLLATSQHNYKGIKEATNAENVATITFETSEYLAKTPCVNQNPQVIEGFLKALAPYKLSSFEKLQLLNIRPTSLVELHLVIEDMDERLGEERVGQLLDLVAKLLPAQDQETMETQ
ncbi:hypothetical protein EMCRGX_G024736 [Ephydatia muelleri]